MVTGSYSAHRPRDLTFCMALPLRACVMDHAFNYASSSPAITFMLLIVRMASESIDPLIISG